MPYLGGSQSKRRRRIQLALQGNSVSVWWWVATVSNGLSDGIRQVPSAECGGRRIDFRSRSERAVNPQTWPRNVAPGAFCSHPQPRELRERSTSLSDESAKMVGRDINRGLVVACLILTTAVTRASSDLDEKDRFLTWLVRGEFPAFSAEKQR